MKEIYGRARTTLAVAATFTFLMLLGVLTRSSAAVGIAQVRAPADSRLYAGGTNPRVQVYNALNGQPTSSLNALQPEWGAAFLSVDKQGNVYVADQGGYDGHSGDTLIYPKGATIPTSALIGENYIASQACPADNGTVYVVNSHYAGGQQTGNVAVYSASRAFPSFPASYLSPDPNWSQPKSCAIDASGNLFVAFNDNIGGAEVDEYAAGSSAPTNLGWRLPDAGGIACDGAGDLLIPIQTSGTATGIYVYKPGNPSPLKELAAGVAAGQVAVTSDHKAMWVSDVSGLSLDKYDLSSGALLVKITADVKLLGLPIGIAVGP